MPFIFAIGIACLAFAGEMLVSAQSIVLWGFGFISFKSFRAIRGQKAKTITKLTLTL